MSTSTCSTSSTPLPWRKRSLEMECPIKPKQSLHYYFRLESESSTPSADDNDTESVYSIQDKETDVVRDTTDTMDDTLSDASEYDIDIEYEIGSLSDDDGHVIIFESSDESEDVIFAAAVVGDSSLETFITDAEDSDNSCPGDSSTGLTDFWVCIQCKAQNDHPQYRFCDKCYQDRKAVFPPRPRPRKKAERKEKSHSPVKLDALQSCLNGLSSQDSGVYSCSSQEFETLCLDQIVVPNSDSKPPPAKSTEEEGKNRKRQISESSLSDECEVAKPPPPKKSKTAGRNEKDVGSGTTKNETCEKQKDDKCADVSDDANSTRTNNEQVKGPLPELKEDCIICNVKPKNSAFLHGGRIAHMCCCYSCAMRTWKSLKRCPICKRKVSNVVRVFTA